MDRARSGEDYQNVFLYICHQTPSAFTVTPGKLVGGGGKSGARKHEQRAVDGALPSEMDDPVSTATTLSAEEMDRVSRVPEGSGTAGSIAEEAAIEDTTDGSGECKLDVDGAAGPKRFPDPFLVSFRLTLPALDAFAADASAGLFLESFTRLLQLLHAVLSLIAVLPTNATQFSRYTCQLSVSHSNFTNPSRLENVDSASKFYVLCAAASVATAAQRVECGRQCSRRASGSRRVNSGRCARAVCAAGWSACATRWPPSPRCSPRESLALPQLTRSASLLPAVRSLLLRSTVSSSQFSPNSRCSTPAPFLTRVLLV